MSHKTGIGIAIAVLAAAGIVGAIVLPGSASDDEPVAKPRPVSERKRTKILRENKLHAAHLESKEEKVPCRGCHQFSASEILPDLDDKCLACHEDTPLTAHDNTGEAGDGPLCVSCHDFGATGKNSARAVACMGCHDKKQGERPPIVVHARRTCSDCHNPHAKQPVSRRACSDATCHDDQAPNHGKPDPSGKGVCRGCHEPHEAKAKANKRCADCHASGNKEVPLVFRFAGHKDCTQCHQAHDFSRGGAKPCKSCHDDLRVLAAGKVAKHTRCTSCHQTPHDPLGGVKSCASCHRDTKVVGHPRSRTRGACGGCHRIHSKRTVTGTVSCFTCHQKAASEAAFHKGDDDEATCEECHLPHQFKPKHTICKLCHSDQVSRMRKGSGHRECSKCHEPHQPDKPPPACSSCHDDQVRTAPRGHGECRDCHGKTHAKRSKPKACATCHSKQARAPHGNIRAGCQSCHRPHGPKGRATPPACGTAGCHTAGSLPRLHDTKEHQTCSDCHDKGHAKTRTTRATCTTSCHETERTHVVRSKSCVRCHKFRR